MLTVLARLLWMPGQGTGFEKPTEKKMLTYDDFMARLDAHEADPKNPPVYWKASNFASFVRVTPAGGGGYRAALVGLSVVDGAPAEGSPVNVPLRLFPSHSSVFGVCVSSRASNSLTTTCPCSGRSGRCSLWTPSSSGYGHVRSVWPRAYVQLFSAWPR